MPEGSSSLAPVTMPGPRMRMSLLNRLFLFSVGAKLAVWIGEVMRWGADGGMNIWV